MSRKQTLALIAELARLERAPQKRFVAPCVQGGQVRSSLDGLVMTWAPTPRRFEGWGLFEPLDRHQAVVVEPARPAHIARWLERCRRIRFVLARQVSARTWLGFPADTEVYRSRLGEPVCVLIRLVAGARAFEVVVARWDGAAFWFEQCDRGADPRVADALRAQLAAEAEPEGLRISGMTPEARAAYDIALSSIRWVREAPARAKARRIHGEGDRLRKALALGGGALQDYTDQGDHWHVEWLDRHGHTQSSAIAKDNLTVISSGICLDGHDRDFDLESLVGVYEGADYIY